jgi:hypothetical protein
MLKYNWKPTRNLSHKSNQLFVKFTKLHHSLHDFIYIPWYSLTWVNGHEIKEINQTKNNNFINETFTIDKNL